jgi:hypothetical protein
LSPRTALALGTPTYGLRPHAALEVQLEQPGRSELIMHHVPREPHEARESIAGALTALLGQRDAPTAAPLDDAAVRRLTPPPYDDRDASDGRGSSARRTVRDSDGPD